ncbi:olfactory receptor 4B13-like [Mantella aurantiaca]
MEAVAPDLDPQEAPEDQVSTTGTVGGGGAFCCSAPESDRVAAMTKIQILEAAAVVLWQLLKSHFIERGTFVMLLNITVYESNPLAEAGLRELQDFKYVYSVISLGLYLMTMTISSMIIYITFKEETLHEPMYIFISNLVFNAMYGGTTYFPKFAIDLLSGCSTISYNECTIQGFCLQYYAIIDLFTFTIMAYDRYLAVSHALRYHNLMTNERALKSTFVIWLVVFIVGIAGHVLTTRVTLCGTDISNVICETFSLLHLACGSTLVNDIFGTTWTLLLVIVSVSVVIYCYIRTFLICFKTSTKAYQKAINTLVTHMIAFSTYMVTGLFIVFRYRLKGVSLSTIAHLVISMICLTVSVTLNPLIYGIRTEALRIKIVHRLRKINKCMYLYN